MTRKIIITMATTVIFLFGFYALAFAQNSIEITQVQGDSLVRELGDYMWKNPNKGTELYAGDRMRVRGGELAVLFPQAEIRILDEGEMEIPVEVVDGYAGMWENDLDVYIGTYEIRFREQRAGLELTLDTPFADITADDNSVFNLDITASGMTVEVLFGKVTIECNESIKEVPGGNIIQVNTTAIKVEAAPHLKIGNPEPVGEPERFEVKEENFEVDVELDEEIAIPLE